MSREFEVAREVDLPASPDDVWTAITADPAAWMFPTGMEIPAGASPPEGAPVTTWDPPNRLVIRMESPDGTFNALDYTIEARDGGTAHLRYVHSGILADGWEDQYDAIGGHTDFYLHTLGEYLEHFNGRDVTYVGQPSSGIEGPESAGDAGRDGHAARGARRRRRRGGRATRCTRRSAAPARSTASSTTHAAVHRRPQRRRALAVLRPQPLRPRGRMSAHLFRDDVDAAAREAALKAWLDGGLRLAPGHTQSRSEGPHRGGPSDRRVSADGARARARCPLPRLRLADAHSIRASPACRRSARRR